MSLLSVNSSGAREPDTTILVFSESKCASAKLATRAQKNIHSFKGRRRANPATEPSRQPDDCPAIPLPDGQADLAAASHWGRIPRGIRCMRPRGDTAGATRTWGTVVSLCATSDRRAAPNASPQAAAQHRICHQSTNPAVPLLLQGGLGPECGRRCGLRRPGRLWREPPRPFSTAQDRPRWRPHQIGKSTLRSATNAGILALVFASSSDAPMKRTPRVAYCFSMSTSIGISSLQGTHQVAQKLRTTGLPRISRK